MSSHRLPRTAGAALLVFAVCLIAANMRATITGVGPLLDQIAADLGTRTAALGALASIPLFAWAVVSPIAHGLSERFGMSQVVLYSLIALGLGTIWRSVPGNAVNLWLGTALIGATLAVANVLMPAVIKREFAGRVPVMMGAYTALLGGVGAIASGVVVPISHLTGEGSVGWRIALVATGALLPIAIALWVWVISRSRRAPILDAAPRQCVVGIWRDPVAWQVAAYMGLQASVFYMLVTWLAPIASSYGTDPVRAGIDVMVFQIFSLIGSLAVPLLLRGRLRRLTSAFLPFATIAGALGLLLAPAALTVWVMFAGLGVGASLGMSLTLMAERARDHSTSSALSGMSQSAGYLFAAMGPIAFGALHALTGGWALSLLVMIGLLIAQGGVGLALSRERLVLERR